MRARLLTSLISVAAIALAVGLGMPVITASPAVAGPAAYTYQREWIYSTNASEIPEAIAVSDDGRIYVVGPRAGATGSIVRVYNADGRLVTTWPYLPYEDVGGVAVGPNGQIHIAHYSGAQVHVYSAGGAHVRTYGLSDDSATFGDIALAPNGTAYITDPVNDSIHKFAANGTYVISFGGSGTAPGRYGTPWDVDVLRDGNLVVADTDNNRIQIVSSSTGQPIRTWGQAGTGNGQFSGFLINVEVGPDGFIYAGDTTSRIQVFSTAGHYLGKMTASTKRAGSPISPLRDIAFGPDRAMYSAGTLYPFENGIAKYVLAGAAAGVAKVKASKKGVKVAKKRVKLTIKCVSATPCSGTLTLATKGKKGKRLAKPKAYTLPAGGKATVKVKLTKKGRKTIRKKPVTKAVATVTGSTKKIKIRR